MPKMFKTNVEVIVLADDSREVRPVVEEVFNKGVNAILHQLNTAGQQISFTINDVEDYMPDLAVIVLHDVAKFISDKMHPKFHQSGLYPNYSPYEIVGNFITPVFVALDIDHKYRVLTHGYDEEDHSFVVFNTSACQPVYSGKDLPDTITGLAGLIMEVVELERRERNNAVTTQS